MVRDDKGFGVIFLGRNFFYIFGITLAFSKVCRLEGPMTFRSAAPLSRYRYNITVHLPPAKGARRAMIAGQAATPLPTLICFSIFLLIASLFILWGMVTMCPVSVCLHRLWVPCRWHSNPAALASLIACLVVSMGHASNVGMDAIGMDAIASSCHLSA